jgi:hypothetical protein
MCRNEKVGERERERESLRRLQEKDSTTQKREKHRLQGHAETREKGGDANSISSSSYV